MKKDIRYTWVTDPDYAASLASQIGENYDFILDPKNPDYIFASQDIFMNPEAMSEFRYYKDQKEKPYIYIFFADECATPDMNIFDYAISFDDNFNVDDRCMRYYRGTYGLSNVDEAIKNPMQYLAEKTKFCNFIYSNANAHPMRDNLFHKITEYKKVDSLGPHLNNCENHSPRAMHRTGMRHQ